MWALGAACGGAAATRPATQKAPPPPAATAATEPAPPPAPPRVVKIKGITGTLNKDDVHQTMDARQAAFDACIQESRRRLRWVNGAIKFAFKVAADGTVAEVRATESNVGHRSLETCLVGAVAATQFPPPAGQATAEFEWGLSVVPATARVPEEIEPDVLSKVLDKNTPKILDHCEVRKRERFAVTAYVTRKGRVVSAGAIARPAKADEKVDCVLGELANLRLPKLKHEAKVSFELR